MSQKLSLGSGLWNSGYLMSPRTSPGVLYIYPGIFRIACPIAYIERLQHIEYDWMLLHQDNKGGEIYQIWNNHHGTQLVVNIFDFNSVLTINY